MNTVFTTLTDVNNGDVRVYVTKWEVIDAGERILRSLPDGRVRVIPEFETIHDCEREAWERAARELVDISAAVQARARECLQKAAAAGIVQVPA